MKEIFAGLLKFLLEVLKALDWKVVLYKTSKATILPLIAKKVQDSTSKVDDVIYKGLEQIVEKFLAPDIPKLEEKLADGHVP